mgnify:CR=1 FL=1
METFRQAGALLEGHFILRSGLRSREFFQCATALEKMPTVEKLGKALADKVRGLEIDTVVAPAMGGLVIGQEVARQLGARFIFVEKEDGSLVLRRGFKFYPEEKVLIVEDVVTRGGRADEAINIVQQEGSYQYLLHFLPQQNIHILDYYYLEDNLKKYAFLSNHLQYYHKFYYHLY